MGKAHKGNIHCSCLAFDLFCLSTQNDVIGADGFCNEKAKRQNKKLDRIFSLNCITGCKNIKVLWCFKVLYRFCLTIFYRALQKSKPRLSSAVERQFSTKFLQYFTKNELFIQKIITIMTIICTQYFKIIDKADNSRYN